jgi:hypothetical protein
LIDGIRMVKTSVKITVMPVVETLLARDCETGMIIMVISIILLIFVKQVRS